MNRIGVVSDAETPYQPIHRPFSLKLPEEYGNTVVDHGVWDSLLNHIWFGLDPGSYGTSVLIHDYDGAMRTAHCSIRRWRDELGDDITANMIRLIQVFPDVCHGSVGRVLAWQCRGGLEQQTQMQMLFKLSL